LSKSLVTICDIIDLEKYVSFNPRLRNDVQNSKVTFQTCNNLVICTIFGGLGPLQVWHRQDPAGFKCTYSLGFRVYRRNSFPFLAPDSLTVIIKHLSSSSSITCYSWNHDTAQFDPIQFDDQVHITWYPPSAYSPDGKLFACWSHKDFHVQVWDTQTHQVVSKFLTSRADEIALSPALIDHSLSDRLITLKFEHEEGIQLFDAYTGH